MKIFDHMLGVLPAKYRPLVKQFFKFGVTGTIGAIVDFSIYGFLTRAIGWTTFYVVFGQQIVLANNVSTICAIVSNFFINKYWTFQDRGKNFWGQWASYFTLNFITWVMNQFLMSFFSFRVPLLAQVFGDRKDLAAKVLAIGVILFFNFIGTKLFVFKLKRAA